MRRFLAITFLVLGAGGAIGCVTKSTTTDGDRQVEDQARKANAIAAEKVQQVRATLAQGSQGWTMLGIGLAALEDVEAGLAQLQTVHGPPANPVPGSRENMNAAIAQSKKDHAGFPWGDVAYVAGGTAVGLLGAWLGMPWLSRLFPSRTGVVGKAAETGAQMITAFRKEAEEDGPLGPKRILEIAKEYAASAPPGAGELLNRIATTFEEKLGYKPAVKLKESTAPATAAPAPTT